VHFTFSYTFLPIIQTKSKYQSCLVNLTYILYFRTQPLKSFVPHTYICRLSQYSNVAFPFRKETFITSPTKAKAVLGWTPKHKFDKGTYIYMLPLPTIGATCSTYVHYSSDIVDEVAAYVASPAANEAWGTEQLRADLEVGKPS
jgi:hypothetical protein